jgi:hypothetical protein
MRKHVRSVSPLLLAGLALWVVPAARADVAHLVLDSQAGDFVGGGKHSDVTYTPANTNGFFFDQIIGFVGGKPDFLRFIFLLGPNVTPDEFATLDFATHQLGVPIQVGTYGSPGNTAQRASFATAGHAGLDVGFEHRGSNTLTGNFTVNSLSFVLDGSNVLHIGSFDVNFEQHSEGATPALFGHFTFQSSLAAVPEPSPLLLSGLAGSLALGIGWHRRRATAA